MKTAGIAALCVFGICQMIHCSQGETSTTSTTSTTTLPSVKKCPDGYTRFESSCYLFCHQTLTWVESLVFCRAIGAHLCSVESTSEKSFLSDSVGFLGDKVVRDRYGNRVSGNEQFWVSATGAAVPGKWQWIPTRRPVNFSVLGMTMDENSNDCLSVSGAGMKNEKCNIRNRYICEIDDQ